MKSKTLTKIVLLQNDDIECVCNKKEYSTCAARLKDNLPCEEMIIRLTTVDREKIDNKLPDTVRSLDSRLRNTQNSFMGTLDHFDRMK